MPATVYTIKDNLAIDLKAVKGVTVVVTVPAAFSGTCTNICVPEILEASSDLKEAGADLILIVSEDQPHAIQRWVDEAHWNEESRIAFASDFGNFEMRAIVGKLKDEEGKENLPPTLGELVRRSYLVVKDGKIVWQYTEPNSSKYTLDVAELLAQVRNAKQA